MYQINYTEQLKQHGQIKCMHTLLYVIFLLFQVLDQLYRAA